MATKRKATARKSAKGAIKAVKGGGGAYRVAKTYKSPRAVSVKELPFQFSRADLEFIGVDHSGASYEARVFINNPNADQETPKTEASGYAGSFSVFGHGGCFGDVGHCDINQRRDEFDLRPSHPLEAIKKVVIATDAIKKAAAQSADITITVIPVVMSWTDKSDLEDVLKFDHINLVSYD
ncbi:MAG TPA: hypothetical protein VN937_23675 [Blastocatellia bacterium]|nr:hypothetical protein [Blastocatellia bacterium]